MWGQLYSPDWVSQHSDNAMHCSHPCSAAGSKSVRTVLSSNGLSAWRRVKVLKRHAQAAITLAPSSQPRSFLVDDLAGATIAGLAMGFALVTLYLAQRSSAQFGVLYVMIYILGYMAKVFLYFISFIIIFIIIFCCCSG